MIADVSTANSINGYQLIFAGGWIARKYVASAVTAFFTDSTHQQLTNGSSATMRIAIRNINSVQYVFFLVNGVLLNGAPVADSSFSTGYGGFYIPIPPGQTPAATDSVYSSFGVTNVDWSAATFTVSPSSVLTNLTSTTVTLAGSSTAWTGGTTFAASGVSGVSVTGQSNTSGTAETVTLNTGSSTGTVTLTGSDGSTGTFTVTSGSFTAAPSTVPSNHGGNIVLALTGTGTGWVNGTTTFTISGVTGAAKVSQTVTSTTAATLTITTGSGTGTLTISDGTLTSTVTVATPSITVSPTSGVTSTTPTVTFTGTHTLWSQGISFSVSGGTGTSIAGCSASLEHGGNLHAHHGQRGGNVDTDGWQRWGYDNLHCDGSTLGSDLSQRQYHHKPV